MFRRTSASLIDAYKFGHPPLSAAFGTRTTAARSSVAPAAVAAVKKTTLPNGVTVITHDQGGVNVALGFYVGAGPVFDPVGTPGLSHIMRVGIMGSNMDSSYFQLDRAMRANGLAFGHAEIRKRYLAWKIEGRADGWERALEHLATCIAAPRLAEPDIERFRDTLDNQAEEQRWQRPRDYVVEQLEQLCFFKEPLGNPRQVLPTGNDACTSAKAIEQYAQCFAPSNVVIAGVNVDHDKVIATYTGAPFPHSASAPHFVAAARDAKKALAIVQEEAAQYQPRESVEYENRAKNMGTRPDMEDEVIAALAFNLAKGGRDDAVGFATGLVIQSALQSALGFTSRVGHTDTTFAGVGPFFRAFSTTGLIGATVRGEPDAVAAQLREAADGLKAAGAALASGGQALAAAKERAAVAFFAEELEMSRDYCDALGTAKVSADEVLAAIKAVDGKTAAAAVDAARAAKPSLFATGKIVEMPTLKKLKL